MVASFEHTLGQEQFAIDVQWIRSPDIHFAISVNGVSLWLVVLSTFLTPLCVLISWRSIQNRVKEFYAFLLLLEFALIGVFISQDLFLFFVFWEVQPGAHVLPHRHLGPRSPHLRRREILPLHHGRLRADAGGHHLPVQPHPDLQLRRHPRYAGQRPPGLRRRRADAAVPGLLRGLRHQGAHLPAAHLAARRARGSALGRLRDAGFRNAEDGHATEFCTSACRCFPAPPTSAPPGSPSWPSSASSTARWWPWCSPTSKSWWPIPR